MSADLEIPAYLEHALAGLRDASEVGPTLNGLLSAVRGLLSAESAYILRRQGNALALMAADPPFEVAVAPAPIADGGSEARAVTSGLTVIDRASRSPFVPRPELALVATPIIVRGETLGVLAATRPSLFVPSEVRWLRILAQVGGIALENARLLEAERRRARYGETVGALATIERVDVGPFCQRMAAVVNDVMNADLTDVMLSRAAVPAETGRGATPSGDRGELIRLGESRREDVSFATGLDRIDIMRGGAFAASFLTSMPYRCADAQENPKAPAVLRDIGIRSILAVPIPGDDVAQGLLIVASRQPSAFDSDDAAFLRLIAERVGLLLRHADVERERARTSARQEFLTVVSHELKTPVAVIKAYGEVLVRRGEVTDWADRDRQIVDRILDQADRMLAMIEQLLDLQRLEAGRLRLDVSRFDLGALARRSIEAIQATTTRHTFVAKFDDGITVRADRRRVEEVFANLLDNAVKYAPGGGTIVVEIRREGVESVLLSVADQGIGIAPDDIERVFDRFFQIGAGTFSGGHVGLGLGLYIVHEIVERHGGRIWVESTPGRGSTFFARLPVEAEIEDEFTDAA